MKNKKIHKAVKGAVREEFVRQGGMDGRFKTKAVPDKKKKYNRKKAKKIDDNEIIPEK